jgi:hypothetical protein
MASNQNSIRFGSNSAANSTLRSTRLYSSKRNDRPRHAARGSTYTILGGGHFYGHGKLGARDAGAHISCPQAPRA